MKVEQSAPASERMFAEVAIRVEYDATGAVTLSNELALGSYPDTLVAMLRSWAEKTPAATFLAERRAGVWYRRSYAQLWARSGELAAKLLASGCSAERPVMICAPNCIAFAEVAFAAMRVGVPAAPVSTSYAIGTTDFSRLRYAAGMITPAVLYVSEANGFSAAASAVRDLVGTVVTDSAWDALPSVDPAVVGSAEAQVDASTIAKLLLTSGSTDKPKVVPNTHRMLCSNQAMLLRVWPVIAARPPVIVDWLPWNHTFGGNFTFNLALMHGGTYYIDAGKPVPALVSHTIANLREIAPTVYFNVPAGYEALLPYLESDADLCSNFLSKLDFMFSAAAALPQKARDRLDRLARAARGASVPIVGGWGATETSPCSTAVYFETSYAGNIGVPLPGTTIKLVPNRGKMELRVKGPNVMSGYWRQPAATAEAFDDDGYYKIGDAGRFLDEANPGAGIAFDGRVAENFKLSSGTWVNVGALRLAVIDATRPFVQDVVIAGHDRDEIGILVFPNLQACRDVVGVNLDDEALMVHPTIIRGIRAGLLQHNLASRGGSTRVASFLLLSMPPRPAAHEITDKGYINQRAVLMLRGDDVKRLYGLEGSRV